MDPAQALKLGDESDLTTPEGARVAFVTATPNPQTAVYLALHTDYSEEFVYSTDLPESECGEIAVKRLLQGNRGHYGPLEHPQLSLLVKADHNTIMQLRTHRVGVSFDVQSMRYTGDRICKVASGDLPVSDVFYMRLPGKYRNRQGKHYHWSSKDFHGMENFCWEASEEYRTLTGLGIAEEHARYVLPTCYFQNAMISGNLRTWLHFLDVRLKLDAQDEARAVMEMVAAHIESWAPQIYDWYQSARQGKALLAP